MIVVDGLEVYSVDKEGERQYATSTNFKFNGEDVYNYNPETGTLQLSIEPHLIDYYVETIGGLPAENVLLRDPFGGAHHFDLVKEVISLPRKDGTYFLIDMHEPQAVPEPRRGWFRRLFR